MLDSNPDNVTANDFFHSIIEQIVCLGADIVMSVSVLALLYFQNRDRNNFRKKKNKKKSLSELLVSES